MLRALRSCVLAFSWMWLAVVGLSAAESSVDELLPKLDAPDREVKLQAIDELSESGAASTAAVPKLIELLQSDDQEVAWHAARTLGALGPDAGPAVAALTKALSHGDPQVRGYAAFALGRIGKEALPSVSALVKLAFEDEELVRRASIRALHALDPPPEQVRPLVLKILEGGDPKAILPALQTLAREGERVVPRLIDALDHKEARYWACLALSEIGPGAAAAVPKLSEVLSDENPEVRLQAIIALEEIGEAAQPAVPAMLAALENDPFPSVRHAAVFALGKLKAPAADSALRQTLESDDPLLRILSAWALARTNPADRELVKRAVREIIGAFKSEDVHVRRAAARAVADFDADPELVAPALVEALRDKDPSVVANAIDALAQMGPRALRNVNRALQNPELRFYAVRLVARVGHEAESAVPALLEALKQPPQSDQDVEFVREAQFALAAVGPGAAEAVPTLLKSLSSEHEQISASAAFALGKIGAAARPAVPALRNNLKSDNFLVKLSSLRALLQIQPNEPRLAKVAAPLLIQALANEREMIRAEAASALGELGGAGKPAVPQLKKLLTDSSEIVRKAATEALKKIEG